MPTRVIKNKAAVVVTEYELRGIDAYGDAVTVEHYETESEALAFAPKILIGECVAWALEKHVSRRPDFLFSNPDVYTVLGTGGDADALREGGWVK